MKINDNWASGDVYEQFMGRWSRLVADQFVKWLDVPPRLTWIDLGCGTGALTDRIQRSAHPKFILGIDPSATFVQTAQDRHGDNGYTAFKVGSGEEIRISDDFADILVSGLAINFFANLPNTFLEMKRVVKKKGSIAIYVWDYADKMEFLRYFWDTAIFLNPGASQLDEGTRFSICKADYLISYFEGHGLEQVKHTNLDIPTYFKNFEDFWGSFLGKVGPAPSYLATLNQEQVEDFRHHLRQSLPVAKDGSISLIARALAIQGKVSSGG